MKRVVRLFLTKEEKNRKFGELTREYLEKAFEEKLDDTEAIDEVFLTVEELGRILTPRRIELLQKIRELKPSSIKELAEKIGRDFKNVYNDLKALHGAGFVEFEEDGKSRRPYLPYDELEFKLDEGTVNILEKKTT